MDVKANEGCLNKSVILTGVKDFLMDDKKGNQDPRREALKEVRAKLKDLEDEINRKKKRLKNWEDTLEENLETLEEQRRAYEYELEQLQKYSIGSTGNQIEDERELKKRISETKELRSKTEREMVKEKNRMEDKLDELITEFNRAKRRKERLENHL